MSLTKITNIFQSGEFVTTFGEGILSSPECIAIDENGYIYVTNACKVSTDCILMVIFFLVH